MALADLADPQKVVHTVATALHLMDGYPDYHFALSAPQTWAYVRDGEPDLYRRMMNAWPRAASSRSASCGSSAMQTCPPARP